MAREAIRKWGGRALIFGTAFQLVVWFIEWLGGPVRDAVGEWGIPVTIPLYVSLVVVIFGLFFAALEVRDLWNKRARNRKQAVPAPLPEDGRGGALGMTMKRGAEGLAQARASLVNVGLLPKKPVILSIAESLRPDLEEEMKSIVAQAAIVVLGPDMSLQIRSHPIHQMTVLMYSPPEIQEFKAAKAAFAVKPMRQTFADVKMAFVKVWDAAMATSPMFSDPERVQRLEAQVVEVLGRFKAFESGG